MTGSSGTAAGYYVKSDVRGPTKGQSAGLRSALAAHERRGNNRARELYLFRDVMVGHVLMFD